LGIFSPGLFLEISILEIPGLFQVFHASRNPAEFTRFKRKDKGSDLDDDPLVRRVLQDAAALRRVRLDLLPDGGGDGRHEGQRVQVKVVTKDLSKHLGGHQLLWTFKEEEEEKGGERRRRKEKKVKERRRRKGKKEEEGGR